MATLVPAKVIFPNRLLQRRNTAANIEFLSDQDQYDPFVQRTLIAFMAQPKDRCRVMILLFLACIRPTILRDAIDCERWPSK